LLKQFSFAFLVIFWILFVRDSLDVVLPKYAFTYLMWETVSSCHSSHCFAWLLDFVEPSRNSLFA